MLYKTLVFAGPSAVGKTFIADQLMQKYPGEFEQARLYTTRQPREGETATDRIFVSLEEFDDMVSKNMFVVHAEFGGNMYGFTEEALHPKDKHLLVNAWPWLIPQFSKLPHAVIVGMQAPEDWQELLVPRMRSRGDSEDVVAKRLELIKKDYADLQNNKELTKQHGKFFVINDDTTTPQVILPWIKATLNL